MRATGEFVRWSGRSILSSSTTDEPILLIPRDVDGLALYVGSEPVSLSKEARGDRPVVVFGFVLLLLGV